jgi:hypothetical protein
MSSADKLSKGIVAHLAADHLAALQRFARSYGVGWQRELWRYPHHITINRPAAEAALLSAARKRLGSALQEINTRDLLAAGPADPASPAATVPAARPPIGAGDRLLFDQGNVTVERKGGQQA